jgi:hypothetical protein
MGGGCSPSYSFGHPGASWSATTDLLATNKQIIGEEQAFYMFGTELHTQPMSVLNIQFIVLGQGVFPNSRQRGLHAYKCFPVGTG